jgi:hypothetical protein
MVVLALRLVPSADSVKEAAADEAELSCLALTVEEDEVFMKVDDTDGATLLERIKVSVVSEVVFEMPDGMAAGQKLHRCRPS